MSLKLSDNIESVKHSTEELAKIYVGEDLVFEHDKPVWLVRLSTMMLYSLDAINFTVMKTWTGSEHFYGGCFADGRFIYGRLNDTNLWTQLPKDVAKGIYRYYGINTSYINQGVASMASNGENVIAIIPASQSRVVYSLDGGKNWNYTKIDSSIDEISYIGNNRFYLHNVGDGNKGHYFYWNADNPGTYYNTDIGLNKNVLNVCRCNDNSKTYYISVAGYDTYYSYNGKDLIATVPTLHDSGYSAYPDNFVYCYGKYYCIYRGFIYSSTDGKTFSKITFSEFNSFTEIQKSNNKLTFVRAAGKNTNFGIINSNNTLTYTTVNDSQSAYTDAYGKHNWLCNRFPKI